MRQFCLATGQKFVVDNTSPTVAERRKSIEAAMPPALKSLAVIFTQPVQDAIDRNSWRKG